MDNATGTACSSGDVLDAILAIDLTPPSHTSSILSAGGSSSTAQHPDRSLGQRLMPAWAGAQEFAEVLKNTSTKNYSKNTDGEQILNVMQLM